MLSVYAAAAWTKSVIGSGEAWGCRESGWVGGRCNAADQSIRATGVLGSNARESANAIAEGVLDGDQKRGSFV